MKKKHRQCEKDSEDKKSEKARDRPKPRSAANPQRRPRNMAAVYDDRQSATSHDSQAQQFEREDHHDCRQQATKKGGLPGLWPLQSSGSIAIRKRDTGR